MAKLTRGDMAMLQALDRALGFDRAADRARASSPSVFPPDITCTKSIFDDGTCEHVYHHRTLGELGRLRIERRGGATHIGGLVSGHTDDPLYAQREALFTPLMDAFARAANRRCIQGKHMPCPRCGAIAASLIFTDRTEPHAFEDIAREMYAEYSRGTAPVWIIGPPVGSGPEPERAADILKVWPTREPMRRLTPAQFNPICDRFVDQHCSPTIVPLPGRPPKKRRRASTP
jgi:hypothetical protein